MPPSSPRRRWAAALALVMLATAGAGLAVRGAAAARARLFYPTGAAEWIWTPLNRHATLPVAFLAVRDFDLDEPPAAARLLAAGDEEYVLYLNGKLVGAGAHAPGVPGAPLDVYEVGPLLRPGGNRLVAELRSARGAGGFLARLEESASGRTIVASDGRWRRLDRHPPGLVSGLALLGEDAEPAAVWGVPRVGRWGIPRPGPARPLFADLAGLPLAAGAARITGRRADFDWGREVVGYLALAVAPGAKLRLGLLATDREPGPAPVLVAAGDGEWGEWMDARVRRFRRVRVVGLAGLVGARVYPVAPEAGAPLLARPLPPAGMLGITPPPLRTPVEDEVRRELKSVAGVAGGEDL